MLTVSALAASHGPTRALREVTLSVGAGAFVAVLGGNGAGKTTLLRAIAGLHRPIRGAVQFRGADISRLAPARILRRGVVLVPNRVVPPPTERRAALPSLTVEEHLSLGTLAGRGQAMAMLDRVYTLFPQLYPARRLPADALDLDSQRMLAIGRAVMTRPRVLLLDEPTAGLSETATDVVLSALVTLHSARVAILLAEQSGAAALSRSDYGYVMQRGGVIAQGKPADLRSVEAAMEAFLG